MPSIATVKASIETKLETLMTAESAARMVSDFLTVCDQVPAGEARYQLRGWPSGESTLPDSNVVFRPRVEYELVVVYHIDESGGDDEQDWTEGRMTTIMRALIDPDWWDDVSGVFYVDEDPEAPISEISRVGDLVSFQVTVALTIDEA